MKRKVFLIVCTVCLTLGIVVSTIGVILGGNLSYLNISNQNSVFLPNSPAYTIIHNFSNFFNIPTSTIENSEIFTTSETPQTAETPNTTKTAEIENFQTLDLEISSGNVIIQTGDTPSLVVEGNLPYTSSFENGKWKIKATSNKIITRMIDGVTHFYLNGEDVTTTFIITVPSKMEKLKAQLSVGKTTITGLTLEKLELTGDVGSVFVDDCTVKKSTFENSVGNLEITNLISDECTIKNSVGNVSLNGTIVKSLTATTDIGNFEATLKRPSSYRWNIDSDLFISAIKIDGEKIRTQTGFKNEDDGLKLKLSSSTGKIDINFFD